MIEELSHRIYPLPTRRASWHHGSSTPQSWFKVLSLPQSGGLRRTSLKALKKNGGQQDGGSHKHKQQIEHE
jgi:hypothetical protein